MAQSRFLFDAQMGVHQSAFAHQSPYQEKYIPNTGIRLGVHFNQRIGNRIWLRSGFRFSDLGCKTEKKNLIWGTQIDPDTGIPRPDTSGLPQEVQSFFNMRYGEIPILARYIFSNKKLSFYTELGLSSNFYLHTKYVSKIDGQESGFSGMENEARRVTFAAHAGLGLEYAVNSQFSIFSQPNVRHDFTPLYNGLYQNYFFSYGIDLGTRITLY